MCQRVCQELACISFQFKCHREQATAYSVYMRMYARMYMQKFYIESQTTPQGRGNKNTALSFMSLGQIHTAHVF